MLCIELCGCLARVRSILGRAEAVLAKLEVVFVSSLLELKIGSSVGEEASLYGHFSPRGVSCSSSMHVMMFVSRPVVIDEVLAPVLKIMCELHADHWCFQKRWRRWRLWVSRLMRYVLLAPNSDAAKSIRSRVFDHDAILTRIDEVVFTRKGCRLLACLKAASPGCGKAIDCLLADKTSTGKIKKVEKVLRSIGKKSKPNLSEARPALLCPCTTAGCTLPVSVRSLVR